MRALMFSARAVIVVSHDLAALALLCDRALWLDHGKMRMIGPTQEVIAAYTQQVNDPFRSLPSAQAGKRAA
jgi:ABC-type polysaccharide/polyol phosphate transport system ATPase subunit